MAARDGGGTLALVNGSGWDWDGASEGRLQRSFNAEALNNSDAHTSLLGAITLRADSLAAALSVLRSARQSLPSSSGDPRPHAPSTCDVGTALSPGQGLGTFEGNDSHARQLQPLPQECRQTTSCYKRAPVAFTQRSISDADCLTDLHHWAMQAATGVGQEKKGQRRRTQEKQRKRGGGGSESVSRMRRRRGKGVGRRGKAVAPAGVRASDALLDMIQSARQRQPAPHCDVTCWRKDCTVENPREQPSLGPRSCIREHDSCGLHLYP